jgi:RNA polymerase sigma factor for flagellar operon FliA
MSVEDLFLTNLALIERIAGCVCHRSHVDAAETEEFASHVKLKLIEANYAIIRKFEGRSSFSTYLTTVITRMFFQYRVQMWGKWRPSAEARRLGDKGITLERMLTRDGYTLGEAVEILTTGVARYTRAEVERLYARLPTRYPRIVLVSGPSVPETEMPHVDPDERLLNPERRRVACAAGAVVDASIGRFAPEDQVILRMRFSNARKVSEIARALSIDQKKIYKRIEKMLVAMRHDLERAGISRREVEDLLARGDQDVAISKFSPGKNETGHTHHADGGQGNNGRLPG